MKNLFIAAFIILFFVSCVKEDPIVSDEIYACEKSVLNSHPDSTRFQTYLSNQVAQGIPGISMLIQTPEGIWSGAAGVADIPNGIAMQSCNLHKVGSITKTFTGTLILKMYEQNLLDLDDPISMYLSDEIVRKVENAEQATIRQLLDHTSGITDYLSQLDYTLLNFHDNPTKMWTAEEELAYIFDEEADFAPGEFRAYSNSNYLLLGMIAEQVSGLSGEELYESMIYLPLGLNNTFLFQNGENPSNLVRGYFDESGNGSFIDVSRYRRFSNSMVGGISSTVEDLNLFLRAALDTETLFDEDTQSEMLTVQQVPFNDPDDFEFGDENKVNRVDGIGLSWFRLDTDYGVAYGHNGGYNGRRARMWYWPESKSSIVFMYNGSGESLKTVGQKMFRNDMVELLFE